MRCNLKFKLIALLLSIFCSPHIYAQYYNDDDPFGHRFGDDFNMSRGVDLVPIINSLIGSDRKKARSDALNNYLIQYSKDRDFLHNNDLSRGSSLYSENFDLNAPVKCDVPLLNPNRLEFQAANHIILWDDSTVSRTTSTYLNSVWSKQVEILKKNLIDLGVPESQILIVGVTNAAQIEAQITQNFNTDSESKLIHNTSTPSRPKYVYLFGHADRLTAHVGHDSYRFEDRLSFLLENNVSMLGHYGCSFLQDCEVKLGENPMQNPVPTNQSIDPLPIAIQRDQRTLKLFGHKEPSKAHFDDSPIDINNPLVMAELRCTPDHQLVDTIPSIIGSGFDFVASQDVRIQNIDLTQLRMINSYNNLLMSNDQIIQNNKGDKKNYVNDHVYISDRATAKLLMPVIDKYQSSSNPRSSQAPNSAIQGR